MQERERDVVAVRADDVLEEGINPLRARGSRGHREYADCGVAFRF